MLDERAAPPPGTSVGTGFWPWSLERYRRDGVESLALRLQDEFGLSVNLLLWACWCATRFEAAPEIVFRKAIDATAPWRAEVTSPLRGARRFLKGRLDAAGAEALRVQIKTAELAAEEIEQQILDALAGSALTPAPASGSGDVVGRARRNVATYAALAKAPGREGFSVSLLQAFIDRILADEARDDPDKGPQA